MKQFPICIGKLNFKLIKFNYLKVQSYVDIATCLLKLIKIKISNNERKYITS